jgi:outer membrane protein
MNNYLIKGNIPEMKLPMYDGNPADLATASQSAYLPAISLNLLKYMNIATISIAQPVFVGWQIINGNELAKTGDELNKNKQAMTETEVFAKAKSPTIQITQAKRLITNSISKLGLHKNRLLKLVRT